MNWALLLKPLDRRVILSAPVLVTVVALAAVIAGQLDYGIKMAGSRSILVVINSDRDDALEETGNVTLPTGLEHEIAALTRSLETELVTVDTLHALPDFQTAEPPLQSLIIAFAAGELTGLRRFEEARAMLESLPEQERLASGGSFAYAVSLNGLGLGDEALAAYQKHFEANPNHQAGAINYGLLLASGDRHAEAIGVFAHAASITSGKRRGKSLSSQGSSLIALQRYAEAVPLFQRSIEYRPDHSATWRKLAVAQSLVPDVPPTEIEANFRKASALAPGDTRPLLEWANYYFANGRFKSAIPLYRGAHTLATNRFDIQLYRAINLYASGRPTSAKRVLKKLSTTRWSSTRSKRLAAMKAIVSGSKKDVRREIIRLKKLKSDPMLNKYLTALAMLKIGDLKNANSYIAGISDTSQFSLPIRYARGRYFAKKGLNLDAEREFSELTALAPLSALFTYAYSRSLLKADKQTAALTTIETAWRLQSESRKISLEYSHQLNSSGKYAAALTVLKALSSDNPRYAKALILSGEIYENAGATDKAINVYQRVLDLGSENLTVALKLAKLQKVQGRNEEALATVDEIIEWDSGSIEARMLRAELFDTMARSDLEIEELKRVLQLDQNHKPAIEMLSRLTPDEPEKSL